MLRCRRVRARRHFQIRRQRGLRGLGVLHAFLQGSQPHQQFLVLSMLLHQPLHLRRSLLKALHALQQRHESLLQITPARRALQERGDELHRGFLLAEVGLSLRELHRQRRAQWIRRMQGLQALPQALNVILTTKRLRQPSEHVRLHP